MKNPLPKNQNSNSFYPCLLQGERVIMSRPLAVNTFYATLMSSMLWTTASESTRWAVPSEQ